MSGHARKRYLVVGASSGIGEAIALELSTLGAEVALLARRADKLEEVRQKLAPGAHVWKAFDVTRLGEIVPLVDHLQREGGAFDGFVYCAGSGDTGRLRDLSPERLMAAMQVNFYPFVEFVRALARAKTRNHALRVVAISSLASVSNDKYFTPYSASKAALDAAVRCLARELAPKNITINSIRPAIVDVARSRHLDEFMEQGSMGEQIKKSGYQPLGLIPAREIACFAAYLLSDEARHLSGATLPFNGGAAC